MSHTFIDDQDLTRVKYYGQWIQGGGPSEHHGTVASSTVEGDYFTVSFYGSTISVFGTIDATSGGVLTNYSVDGASSAQVTSQAGGGDTYDQQFWRSGWLNVGDHELKVTMVKINPNPEPNEGTIWFDYFKPTDPTIRPPSDSAAKKRFIGEIVGGVLGGLLLSGILLTVWLMARISRRRKDAKHGHERLPDGKKQSSSLPSGHVENERNMSGRGVIRPFIEPPRNVNPSTDDPTSHSPTSPITPLTPATSTGVVPPQKLLQELSRSQTQIPNPTNNVLEPRRMKHINSASSTTLTSASAGGSAFAAGQASEGGASSFTAQTSQVNNEASPTTPTVRLSPIFLGAPERPSPPATLTAKQEAIINTSPDETSGGQGSFEDLPREGAGGSQPTASHPDLQLDGDRQGQAPIILHVDSGVRHTLRLDSQAEEGRTNSGQAGVLGGSAIVTVPAMPIELPPVYSPV